MKIAYLILGTFNSGGMERVLSNKANYLADVAGYDVSIVTTDQCGREPFFRFSVKIRHYDLGIDYANTNGQNILKKTWAYLKKQRLHRQRLLELLNREHFDIVISMFGPEVYWLPELQDGSKKIAEIHFSKAFRRLINMRGGLWSLSDKVRENRDGKVVEKYDRFVVLTEEDEQMWGRSPKLMVIPNARTFIPEGRAGLTSKKAICVGRLSREKGFDRAIKAWRRVVDKHPDWRLDIVGNGPEEETLKNIIFQESLGDAVRICPPTKDIHKEYFNSSVYLLTSYTEGLPMVLLEAMGCGVPAVAFTCKCGPRDVITDGADGILVPEGDVDGLADGICRLIEDESLRRKMGENAVQKVRDKFSEERIMSQWIDLFERIAK